MAWCIEAALAKRYHFVGYILYSSTATRITWAWHFIISLKIMPPPYLGFTQFFTRSFISATILCNASYQTASFWRRFLALNYLQTVSRGYICGTGKALKKVFHVLIREFCACIFLPVFLIMIFVSQCSVQHEAKIDSHFRVF